MISVVLAVYNEEENIEECLKSVVEIASEIVIVDGGSTDKTVEIAKRFNPILIVTDNPPIFHVNKQKALEKATNEWILQLDADERVSTGLGEEIIKIATMSNNEIGEYQKRLPSGKLFLRHQTLLEERDGTVGTDDSTYSAFFIPRSNYFLGKYLKHGGVYPDGVIRLVKKGRAHFPCKSVHEQIVVTGKVGWLQNPLYHMDSPTFTRYLQRNNRYIQLLVNELKTAEVAKDPIQIINYFIIKPTAWFLTVIIRHKGILDGFQGIVFALFSALRFPRAYKRYLLNQ